jgi:Arc/MetJ-type ribon-helix-helix transcriptional regulator
MPTKRPAKQATSITIRLTEQLVDKLREMAHKERRSLSNYVRFVLETHAGFVREERTPEEIGPGTLQNSPSGNRVEPLGSVRQCTN